jgi:hypothetical protein
MINAIVQLPDVVCRNQRAKSILEVQAGVASFGHGSASPNPEKLLELKTGRLGVPSARHDRAMVAGGLVEEARAMEHGAALWVLGSEDHTGHAGQADSANTHGAGLQRHIKSGS